MAGFSRQAYPRGLSTHESRGLEENEDRGSKIEDGEARRKG
jgi:hypothetical protein